MASPAIFRISATLSRGLVGTSSRIARVFSLIAGPPHRIARIDIGRLQPLLGKDLVDDPEGSAVEVLRHDQVVALLEKQQQIGDRGHP